METHDFRNVYLLKFSSVKLYKHIIPCNCMYTPVWLSWLASLLISHLILMCLMQPTCSEHICPTLGAQYLALGTASMITYNQKARMEKHREMSGFEMQI